jgi:hypothetical protein
VDITYSPSTKLLSIVVPKSQNVSVSAYVLSGQQISQFSTKKFLPAGTHTINLSRSSVSSGVIFFRVEGEGFTTVKRINLMEGK